MVAELGYFTIPVADLKRAETFYGAVFGWTVERESSHPRYSHIGNTTLPFGFKLRDPNEPAADMSNFYIRVEDIGAVLGKITAAGGTAGPIGKSPSGRHAVCSDDQGTRFSVWQPAPGL